MENALRDAAYAQLGFFGCTTIAYTEPATPEARAEWEARQAAFATRQAEARGAETRALALLDARLGPTEARLFKRTHTLMRPSRLWPGVEYLIPDGGHEMVRVLEKGREVTRLCVVAGQGEPWPDRTMTILDLIESGQERRLWEMANVFPQMVAGRMIGEIHSATSAIRWAYTMVLVATFLVSLIIVRVVFYGW
jgi:hypothetical protein